MKKVAVSKKLPLLEQKCLQLCNSQQSGFIRYEHMSVSVSLVLIIYQNDCSKIPVRDHIYFSALASHESCWLLCVPFLRMFTIPTHTFCCHWGNEEKFIPFTPSFCMQFLSLNRITTDSYLSIAVTCTFMILYCGGNCTRLCVHVGRMTMTTTTMVTTTTDRPTATT